jgi:hypothetical protein
MLESLSFEFVIWKHDLTPIKSLSLAVGLLCVCALDMNHLGCKLSLS